MKFMIQEFSTLELIKCDNCSLVFESEDIFKYDGYKLCYDCMQKWKADDEAKKIEEYFQAYFNTLPIDQIAFLSWKINTTKSRIFPPCEQEILWMNRIDIALKSKEK